MGLRIEEEKISNSVSLYIFFSERLDVESIANLWRPCIEAVTFKNPSKLIVDFKEVSYCDMAGITLLQTLKELQTKRSQQANSFFINNLNSKFQKLLDYVEQVSWPETKLNLLSNNGHTLSQQQKLNIKIKDQFKIFQENKKNIIFLGSVVYQMFFMLLHLKKFNWRDFWRATYKAGPEALAIIALIGFLIGLISTFQAAPSFAQFGAQIYIVDLVALGLVREMGPLMTAVIFAGRTASFFAAELATMKINQEVDALSIMGLNTIRFLIIPRILAAVIVIPFLNIFFIAFGLLGLLTVMTTLNYPFDAFLQQIQYAVKIKDFLGGVIKATTFGLVIAIIGCLYGLKTKTGPEAVGISTTKAVVISLIILVLVDGVFAAIYYVLDV
ncbi:MAG: MlaE family lipid ABC transporter permease subunit [Oligoflexia bacterium]|nr:MlaE family lipid ABC transporter permease subunit [Oligoflexia bacterium]